MSPATYNYFDGLKNKRRLILNQIIDDSVIDTVVIPLRNFVAEDELMPVEIILNSPGGEPYSGFACIDAILQAAKTTPINLYVYGLCASMGFYIAMCGHKNPNIHVCCNKFAVGLLHGGSFSIDRATKSQARDIMQFEDRYETMIKDYTLSHSTITEEMYAQSERCEMYFTAEDLIKYEIVDEIL